ncbi:MAG TPA: hypothetical protein VJQ84_00265, partial [Solirubrobacterales bacterium]|nr:hypothetical protein [Solirubrobacterales bacterium]
QSDLPLRRLNPEAGTRGELTVSLAEGPLAIPDREPVSTLVDEAGRRWYASYELEDGRCLLELPPSGSFLIEPGPDRVIVERHDGDAELLEHRIASSALCVLLALRGDLVLHASAVEADGRATIFCGPSQRGKSTLAQALGEAGCRLLSEDGIAVELGESGPLAFPGARGVRSRSRDEQGRNRTDLVEDPGGGAPPPCPVAAVVLLEERSEELRVERLGAARALALLTPNLVHSGSRGAIGAAFANLATLLSSVPAFAASLPDDLAALPGSAQGLLDATSSDG